jgi:hypothetical protein
MRLASSIKPIKRSKGGFIDGKAQMNSDNERLTFKVLTFIKSN